MRTFCSDRNCTRPPKMEHEGKPYCGIHNPIARQARRDKAQRISDARTERFKRKAETIAKATAQLVSLARTADHEGTTLGWYRDLRMTLQTLDAAQLGES